MKEHLAEHSQPTRRRRPRRIARPKSARTSKTRRPFNPFPYRNRLTLLSQGEAAFFGPLSEAVAGRFHVMCKVRLADVITCTATNWRRGYGRAISQKHLDFVLCEKGTMRFVLAIELDDRSHKRPERERRDSFVNIALYRSRVGLLRFEALAYYSVETIRRRIDGVLRARKYAEPRMPNGLPV